MAIKKTSEKSDCVLFCSGASVLFGLISAILQRGRKINEKTLKVCENPFLK